MAEQENKSRVSRRKERRKNKKLLSLLSGIVIALLLLWAGNSVIGNDEPPVSKGIDKTSEGESQEAIDPEDDKEQKDETSTKEDSETTNKENESEEETSDEYVIEGSSDENVRRVVKKDWDTIKTEQNTDERHTVSFDRGSKDWNEIIQAVSVATELKEDDMITWRIENGGGPQLASAVVTDSSQENIYRVQVEWQKKEGYKPIQLEILKDNPYN